jgi:hypothetical protein
MKPLGARSSTRSMTRSGPPRCARRGWPDSRRWSRTGTWDGRRLRAASPARTTSAGQDRGRTSGTRRTPAWSGRSRRGRSPTARRHRRSGAPARRAARGGSSPHAGAAARHPRRAWPPPPVQQVGIAAGDQYLHDLSPPFAARYGRRRGYTAPTGPLQPPVGPRWAIGRPGRSGPGPGSGIGVRPDRQGFGMMEALGSRRSGGRPWSF